jgi:hypothetical protein
MDRSLGVNTCIVMHLYCVVFDATHVAEPFALRFYICQPKQSKEFFVCFCRLHCPSDPEKSPEAIIYEFNAYP